MPPRKRRTKAEIERARKRAESSRRHLLKVNHSMTLEEYDELLEYQGGTCYICRRARGISRKLQVDHDHAIAREACAHEHEKSCNNCWRGLLCSRCNNLLGHLRDDPMAFWRAIDYLKQPPARRLWQMPLRQMRVKPEIPAWASGIHYDADGTARPVP